MAPFHKARPLRLALALLLTATAATATPPSSPAPATPSAQPAAERTIAVGDHLRYQVTEDGDPPVELVVSNTGKLDLPYHGPIDAAGLTLPELSAAIRTALESELYIQATVRLQVLEYSQGSVNRGRVHLAGQVRRIGPVDIDLAQRTTLGQVILASGGLSDFADARNVRIIRNVGGQNQTLKVDLREVLEKGRIDKDVELQDGDFVIVDQRLINW